MSQKIKIPQNIRIPTTERGGSVVSYPNGDHDLDLGEALETLASAERTYAYLGEAIANLRRLIKDAL